MDDEIPVRGESHASSSHEVSLEPPFKRREDLGKQSVFSYFHAEDAIVKVYFVLKILVTR